MARKKGIDIIYTGDYKSKFNKYNSPTPNIGSFVNAALQVYRVEVVDKAAETATKRTGKEAAEKLQAEPTPTRTGNYRKSWRSKVTTYSGRLSNEYLATVYSEKPHYRVTHLLEHGHKKRGGSGSVSARVHIEPVQDYAEARWLEIFKVRLDKEGGG